MDLATIHHALQQPSTFAETKGPIGYRETHVSRLYFTPRRVYKFKKPVDLGFLDFSTLEKRRFYCAEEVRLNRRFSPDTYLGVVTLRREDDTIRIGDSGEILDYAVQMNRLPEERMLDRLIDSDAPELEGEMDRLAQTIAEIHREAPVCVSEDGAESLKTLRENWEENFRQTEPFAGETLTPETLAVCATYVEGYMARNESLLRRRDAGGSIRDGHGDLHAEHVCLTDPIRIYDCIEFNRRFRVADTVADLAFLLMDLDYRQRRDLSLRLLERYGEETGESDEMARLLPFYKIYRAYVRGKVESFLGRAAEAEVSVRRAAAARARRYFALALGYLCPPALILTCGLTGVGKSTLAGSLAAALGGERLRSDRLRREIHGLGRTEPSGHRFGEGIYSRKSGERTYDLLLQRALAILRSGRSAIVDASFARRSDRDRFRRAAAEAGVPCHLLHLRCDRDTAMERLVRREAEGTDPSEGRAEIYRRQEESFDYPTQDEPLIEVDSEGEVVYTTLKILTGMIETNGLRA